MYRATTAATTTKIEAIRSDLDVLPYFEAMQLFPAVVLMSEMGIKASINTDKKSLADESPRKIYHAVALAVQPTLLDKNITLRSERLVIRENGIVALELNQRMDTIGLEFEAVRSELAEHHVYDNNEKPCIGLGKVNNEHLLYMREEVKYIGALAIAKNLHNSKVRLQDPRMFELKRKKRMKARTSQTSGAHRR